MYKQRSMKKKSNIYLEKKIINKLEALRLRIPKVSKYDERILIAININCFCSIMNHIYFFPKLVMCFMPGKVMETRIPVVFETCLVVKKKKQ